MRSKELLTKLRRPNTWMAGLLWLAMVVCAVEAPPVRSDDGPTLNKTSILVDTWQLQGYWAPGAKEADFSHTSWIPRVKFAVQGPVSGGSQFTVDFTRPGGAAWMHLDCPTDEIPADKSDTLETQHRDADEKKGTTAVGVYGFKIRLKNALSNQNDVLFTGSFKVGKVDKSNGIAKFKNKYDFYVDHDWLLPIGYVYPYDPDGGPAMLTVGIWGKTELTPARTVGYLFYQGKQITSTKGDSELEIRTANSSHGDPLWQFCEFQMPFVRFPDPKQTDGGASSYPQAFFTAKNPGEYEFKVLVDGKLYRQTKFSIGADGNLVDNGISADNKLGSKRILLPVKVLSSLDQSWNKNSWKTDAFYGNPLKGFEAP